MQLSRRDMLKLGVLGSAALYLPVERIATAKDQESLLRLPAPFSQPFARPADLDLRVTAGGGPITSLSMRMEQRRVALLGPAPTWPQTDLWTYVGPGGQINPTIHVDKGQPIEVRQFNALPPIHPKRRYPSDVSVHLHGSASLPQHDGYASDLIGPGRSKRYAYPNAQAARTLWYHDHAVHHTGENAYAGLAAQYHLHDAMERDSGIPLGAYDIPLTIRDALFDRDGSLLWDDSSQSSLMGDVILVNGVPWPRMPVLKRRYRFRLLNASVSRSYRLSLSDPRAKMWVIGTDAGFMPKPVQVSSLRFGGAERYELVIDFSACADGAQVVLRNADVQNTVEFNHTNKVMRFDVAPGPVVPEGPGNTIPASFYAPVPPNPSPTAYVGPAEIMGLSESMAVKRRRFAFERHNGMWTISGGTWDDVVRSGFRKVIADPALGSIEVWEFENRSGGWNHPIHAHLIDFRILSRNGRAPFPYEVGPKDTTYVGEGETVRVIAKFGPHEGRYMIHCHNLVHEDHDMMAQFRVGPDRGDFPDDPNDPRGEPAE